MYVPKTQTTYKQLAVVERKVDDVVKQSDQLMVYGSDLMAAKLEYSAKIETWIEYKGNKVSDVKISEYRKIL